MFFIFFRISLRKIVVEKRDINRDTEENNSLQEDDEKKN